MFARFVCLLLISGAAFAQAWVPPQGTTSVTVSFQQTHADGHTDLNGVKTRNVDVRSNMLSIATDYSLTDRFALAVSLPYISSRYRGAAPHPGVVDDGQVHGSFQDLRLSLRYMALQDPVVVSPFLAWSAPSRNYDTMGHAAPGRGLEEIQVGLSAGRELTLVPGMFLGGAYSYTIVEKVVSEFSTNRSNAELQLGYMLAPRLFVSAFGSWQNTYGGITLPLTEHDREHHFHQHDQLLRANYIRAGAGLSWSLNRSIDLFVSYAAAVRSENSHSGDSFAVGTSWNFVPRTILAKKRSEQALAASQLRTRDSNF